MGCVYCGNSSDCCFVENLDTKIFYNYCEPCGIAWKTLDNKVVDNSITYDFLNKKWLSFDVSDLSNTCNSSIIVKGFLSTVGTMSSYIKECLYCGRVTGLYKKNTTGYKCINCGFEWRIINCE